MTTPFAEQIEQAMTALHEQQTRMAAAAKELQAATASVTSKDRMVTAKVGAQGQVVSLTFHTTAYRSMAPAQLAGILTDVLNTARAEIGDRVMETMSPFSGIGEVLRTSMTGGTELEEMLAPLRSMRPGFAEEEARRKRERQEEFRG
ncbi:DNA-binding protein YbaB [Kitasatospora sp. MAA4]|uniref:YbaB/EbfC family nucleoid-associated protein n=1 Tax=Kitasatospora sp. MAA4 TaxID=3035093 RepID=UPI0024739DD1|nr:YbaB/EbfC family nucleoid-associated protein [Kitasatospora sp. MAA4]MDH6133267.1 DNA-binding protein YbaB [Kitasatospora sp. MAA4]